MELIPYSFNGYAINDYYWSGASPKVGNWASSFPDGQRVNLSSTAVFSEVAYSFPKLSVTQLGGHEITLRFNVKATSTNAIAVYRDQLKGWFNINDPQPHQLVCYDIDDTNRPWYLAGIPTSVVIGSANSEFLVTLALNDPIWRLVTASTTGAMSVTTAPYTFNLTVKGNVSAKPIITIKPTSLRSGSYSYKRYIPIYNSTTKPFPFAVSSVDITGGGLNTFALVGAGKMLASGYDCRVYVDGIDSNRWFGGGGINSTTTLIWCNIPHSVGGLGTLATALPNNGTTVSVYFTKNSANLAALNALAKAVNKVFIIDSEVFTFTAANQVDLVNYRIKNCLRAQKTTSFAAHTTTTPIYWIQHDVWLLYGNSSATAPNIDATKMPLLDMTASTNGAFVWSATNGYYDSTAARPMAWTPNIATSITNSLSKQALTNYYTADQGAFANPATEMGLQMQSYNHNAVHRAETANMYWTFYHPAGFTSSSMAGKKYLQLSVGVWPAKAGLYKSTDNVNYIAVWNEAVPSLTTWTAFTHNGVTLSGTYQHVRLMFAGSIAAGAGNIAYLQGDTVTLVAGAGTLTVSMLTEQSNYHLDATIYNSTSGESLYVYCTMGANQTLTIDCSAKTASLADGTNMFNAISLSDSRINPDWLDVGQDTNNKFTGAAAMSYTSVGVVAETVTVSWADSSY